MAFRQTMPRTVTASLLLAVPAAMGAAAQTTPAAVATLAPAKAPATHSGTIERQITEWHGRLGITPAQQPQFDAFAGVMRDNAQRMGDLVKQQQQAAAGSTAVDQMQSYSDMAQAHAEDMKRLTTAFSRLYDTMAADQKKAADQSFRQFAARRWGSQG